MRKLTHLALITVLAAVLLTTGASSQAAAGSNQPSPAAAGCVSRVGPGIPPPAPGASGLPGFHAAWHGQSGYLSLCPGERATSVVAFRNSGSFGWVRGVMGQAAYLGTSGSEPGHDRPSVLGGDGTFGSPATGWPRYNRAAVQPAAYVGPRQVSWFQFTVQAPTQPGIYRLGLRPVIEGARWLEDYGVFWQVTVLNPDGTSPPVLFSAPDSATTSTKALLPAAPRAYVVPAAALSVSTCAALQTALAAAARDIVLETGTYACGAKLTANGHGIYSRTLSGALLHQGFTGQWANLQGLRFDVSSTSLGGGEGAILYPTRPSVTQDVTGEGRQVMSAFWMGRDPSGQVLRRARADHFERWGIFAQGWSWATYVPAVAPIFEDLEVNSVFASPRGKYDGTAEANFWFGTKAVVNRIKATDSGWMLVAPTANMRDSVVSDLTLGYAFGIAPYSGQRQSVAIYAEHSTTNVTFRRVNTTNQTDFGFLCEWNRGTLSRGGCQNVVLEDSEINSARFGVYYDEGNVGNITRRTRLIGQSDASIREHRATNTYLDQGNTFSPAPGGVQVRKT